MFGFQLGFRSPVEPRADFSFFREARLGTYRAEAGRQAETSP